MTTPSSYLATAAEIEGKIAALYRAIAERFADDLELVEFFMRMAEEEDSHRNAFLMLIRVMRGFDGEVEVEQRFDRMAAAMNKELDRGLRLMQAGTILDSGKALEIVVKLEMTLIESHGGILLVTTSPELKKTLDMLTRGSVAHKKRLEAFAALRASPV